MAKRPNIDRNLVETFNICELIIGCLNISFKISKILFNFLLKLIEMNLYFYRIDDCTG